MTMAALVNTAVEDGGLNQVLELTTVNSKIVEKIKSEGVVNLVEFTNLWTKSEYEKETLEYRDEVDELKNNRVELARLRSAVLLARAVLDRPPINPEDKAMQDWEQPLDSAAKETISKAWKARYGIQLTMYLDPADPLVNRLYREFRQNSPSLIPVARIRSVYVDHNPSPEKRVALPGGMSITVAGQEQKEVVRDVAHYYYALRILANASAKAGNYMVPSMVEKKTEVVYAPLDINLDYADLAFRHALKQSGTPWATMKWLEDNDLHTRGLMINIMRKGYPQGEALAMAIKETEIKWGLPISQGANSSRRQERSRSPRRSTGNGGSKGGQRGQMPKTPKPHVGKTQLRTLRNNEGKGGRSGVTYASMAKGGKKICSAYNLGNCQSDKCPYGGLHVCNVVQNGRVCMGKHPGNRHTFGGAR
jgi:hypothetical protein